MDILIAIYILGCLFSGILFGALYAASPVPRQWKEAHPTLASFADIGEWLILTLMWPLWLLVIAYSWMTDETRS